MIARLLPALSALMLLAACGSDAGVGGVTAREAEELNQAAATLDARSAQARQPEIGLNPAAQAARDRRATAPR